MKHIKRLAAVCLATCLAAGTVSLSVAVHAQTFHSDKDAPPPASASPKPLIPPEMMARFAHAKWTYPAADQMAGIYPAKAHDNEIEGLATIVCVVAADGYMDKCAVMKETPEGYDFGVTTATLFVKFCHVDPATVDGGIKPGDYKVFTYKWQLG